MLRRAIVRTCCAVAIAFVACAVPPPGGTAPTDVVYEAGATDDAWLTVDAATPTVSDALAPQLTAPTTSISRTGAAPMFAWTPGAVGPSSVDAGETVDPTRTFPEQLLGELFPVAHAHLPPVTGPVFGLTFDLGAGVTPLRVLTGATSYTPFGVSWQRLTSATSPISLSITGTYLNTGRIEQGPYVRSTPATLVLD